MTDGGPILGLAAALAAAILPDRADTLLLRACLLDAASARRSWDDWRAMVGDPKAMLETETRGLKGMLPMIDAASRRHGLPGPDGMGIYLKASTLREELRTRLIAEFLAGAIDALTHDQVPFTLLGGIAAAYSVYDRPSQRHCHAIDLLVAETDRTRTAVALARAGFTPLAQSATEFRHTERLALHLWPDIAFHPHHRAPDGGVAARAEPLEVAGRTVQGACATDRFIMALSRAASTPERRNLRWACDAWLTAPLVDWPLFLAETARRHLALPFALLCRHQAQSLGAAIPADTLEGLDALAAEAGALDREAALAGALSGLQATRHALAAPGVDTATRLAIGRYLAVPSAECMAWSYGPAGGVKRTLQRLRRPASYVISRSRSRLAR